MKSRCDPSKAPPLAVAAAACGRGLLLENQILIEALHQHGAVCKSVKNKRISREKRREGAFDKESTRRRRREEQRIQVE